MEEILRIYSKALRNWEKGIFFKEKKKRRALKNIKIYIHLNIVIHRQIVVAQI